MRCVTQEISLKFCSPDILHITYSSLSSSPAVELLFTSHCSKFDALCKINGDLFPGFGLGSIAGFLASAEDVLLA